ncbi:hypothetical protein GA0115253_109742 [Streptomyces sp. Termitarium-T10T-6]|nr:hypothetical protein GA0115253_109742 [Streptomyces sp. Termitarium-T10T-6]
MRALAQLTAHPAGGGRYVDLPGGHGRPAGRVPGGAGRRAPVGPDLVGGERGAAGGAADVGAAEHPGVHVARLRLAAHRAERAVGPGVLAGRGDPVRPVGGGLRGQHAVLGGRSRVLRTRVEGTSADPADEAVTVVLGALGGEPALVEEFVAGGRRGVAAAHHIAAERPEVHRDDRTLRGRALRDRVGGRRARAGDERHARGERHGGRREQRQKSLLPDLPVLLLCGPHHGPSCRPGGPCVAESTRRGAATKGPPVRGCSNHAVVRDGASRCDSWSQAVRLARAMRAHGCGSAPDSDRLPLGLSAYQADWNTLSKRPSRCPVSPSPALRRTPGGPWRARAASGSVLACRRGNPVRIRG